MWKLCLLVWMFLPTLAFGQTDGVILFQDDFENLASQPWQISDGNPGANEENDGWQIVQDGAQRVFEGHGHYWAVSPSDYYREATFQCRFKLIKGGFHLNAQFRSGRFFFGIHPGHVSFTEQQGDTFTDRDSRDVALSEGAWYAAKFSLNGSRIVLSIDGSKLFEYEDPNSFGLFGRLAFESLGHVAIDDVLVLGDPVFHGSTQDHAWVRTGGPLGGIGYDVRIDPSDPNIIYVTDQWAGCHKSYDGGQTWHPKNEGITSRFGPTHDAIPIFSLTVDPNDPNTVWCGTLGMRGLYKSVDKGEHWALKAEGIPSTEALTFRSFAVEPGNSDVVYCGVEWQLAPDEIPDGQAMASGGKIYKTTDGGENWVEVLDSKALVRTIIIDPTNTNTLYAATGIFDRDDVEEEGIWKSTDGGNTWIHINNGITNMTVGDIEMHPDNPNILLAATGRINGFGGGPNAEDGEILRTIDGGQNWSRVFSGRQDVLFTYVEFAESDANVVYAAGSDRGFFKSLDGGLNWSETAYNSPYVNPGHIISVATHRDRPNWLISNSYGGGVFVSADGAESWQDASKGYTGCEITDLKVNPNDPLRIYATARSSIFESLDGGTNWHGIGAMSYRLGIPMGPLEMRSLAVHPQNPDVIFSTDHWSAIYKTENSGRSWRLVYRIPQEIPNTHEINAFAFAPSNPDVLYAGTEVVKGYLIDRPVPFDPTQPSQGMYKSVDGGGDWAAINTGLESTLQNVNCMAVHPTNQDIVYIGMLNSGVYRTTDGGNNWSNRSSGIVVTDIRSIVIDPSDTNVLYAGAQRGAIYKSIDAGASWLPIPYGMDPEAAIRSIVIDPTNPQTVFAADWFSGVYQSSDGGQSWLHINEGLRTRAVHRLAISSDGKILYAGTQGEGVFRMVMDARPPLLQTVYPDTGQVVHIVQGESALFDVTASDLNGDDVLYSWQFDTLSWGDRAGLTLDTDTLSVGEHQLSLSVSDGVHSTMTAWRIQITSPGPTGDFDGDGTVGFPDFIQFAREYGAREGDEGFEARFDLDSSGDIGFPDFILFARNYGL